MNALKRLEVEAIHSLEDNRKLFRPRRAWSDVINLRLFSCMSLKSQMLVALSVSFKYRHIKNFIIVILGPHTVPLLFHF
jgi:hypothetical protein